VSRDSHPDMSRIDVVDPRVVEILRRMSGMDRLRLAHEMWQLTRERLTTFLRSHHPEWDEAELRLRVADWLLNGSVAAFVAPHPALSPEGRGMWGAEGRGLWEPEERG
jgi:Rv0078B-related antitoxin